MKDSTDMSHTRLFILDKTNEKVHSSSPDLRALPSTREAFIENVKRAHFQTVIWRNPGSDPPPLNPEDFGWKKATKNKSLCPTALPENSKPAPGFVLEMIRWGYKSQPFVTPNNVVVGIKACLAQCFALASAIWVVFGHSAVILKNQKWLANNGDLNSGS